MTSVNAVVSRYFVDVDEAESTTASIASSPPPTPIVSAQQPKVVKSGDRCRIFATFAAIALALGAFLGFVLAMVPGGTESGGLRGGRQLDDDATNNKNNISNGNDHAAEAEADGDSPFKAYVRSNAVALVAATAGICAAVSLACWWQQSRRHEKVAADPNPPPPRRSKWWRRDPSFVNFIFRRAGVDATASDIERVVVTGADPWQEATAAAAAAAATPPSPPARTRAPAAPVRSRTMRFRRRSSRELVRRGSAGDAGAQAAREDCGPPSQSWIRAVAPAITSEEATSASWLEQQEAFAAVIDDFELDSEYALSRATSYGSMISAGGQSTPE